MSPVIATVPGTRGGLPGSDVGRVESARCATPVSRCRDVDGRPRSRGPRVWLACAGLLLALPAWSQVTATRDYLQRMDTDADGRVSLAEYQAWMGYAFERMDRNGDGMLSPDELPGGRGKPVSLVAHRAALAAAFARQDRNGDGWLDARELAAPPQ